jgi:hypothetical protein
VPGALGRQAGDEDERAVGVLGRRVGSVDGDDELAPEGGVLVRRPQLAAGPEPARVDDAAPDQGVGADVEDVGEVRLDRDLDRQADGPASVVGDVEVLVDAARDRPVDAHPQRVAVDEPGVVEEGLVRVFEAGRVELD